MKTVETDPWAIDPKLYPADGTLGQQWEFLLQYAVLAPSSHNTQPWLFRMRQTVLDLYADRQRSCPAVDPDDRELIMSCGCALFHLRCAMRHFGCLGPVEIFPEPHPDLLARVHRGTIGETDPAQTELFEAILQRRTNRQLFSDDPLPSDLVPALQAAAEAEGAWMKVIQEETERLALAELISEGDRRQWANARFRQELSHWVHPNHSARRDGIPGYAAGVDDLMSCMGPMVVRTFDLGEGQAARDSELAMGSPLLVVIGTVGDRPRDWVAGGQALAHVLLRATAARVRASFLNQPIELNDLRMNLAELVGMEGYPQLVLRLGYADNVRPTPRREVGEVLM